ncbi:MAG: DUF5778 family protein [Halapricum sp.]
MSQEIVDEELYEQAEALLEPGEIELNGIVVHTDLDTNQEAALHKLTVEIGDTIAEYAAPDAETYIYSGNDDPEFGLNQHQGLTLADDEFVWECQQLLREGTFRVVFYYEASADQQAIVEAVADTGYTVDSVTS